MLRAGPVACLLAVLAACAAEVQRTPSAAPAIAAGANPRVIRLERDVLINLHTGYTRTLKRDARWVSVGAIAQGEVFKPEGQVLTVEGAHVHEAYMVVSDGKLVGFYLPVKNSFVPLVPPRALPITEQGR